MKILVKDNYFIDPDSVRNLALSINNYRVDNEIGGPPTGWRGQRTLPLRNLDNKDLNEYAKNILQSCYEFFDLKNYFYPYSGFNGGPLQKVKDLTITTYFHITIEETRKAFPDFSQDRFHKDFNTAVAGVIYLNPDAPLKAGTSIFDGQNNQMINVENKYNRLVAYEGSKIHALSDVFGDTVETGRLTFSFFIHESEFIEDFN